MSEESERSRHEQWRSRNFDEVMKLGGVSHWCSSGTNDREEDSEERNVRVTEMLPCTAPTGTLSKAGQGGGGLKDHLDGLSVFEVDEEEEDWHFALPTEALAELDTEAGREDNSEESGLETVTDRQKDVRDNLLTDGQADEERAFVQGESRGSTYPTHTPSPDSLDGAVLYHSEGKGVSPSHQNERSECDAPADRENPVPPISPLMNIQHEPIDEGYGGSLLPQTSIKWIKEEPEHQEDELRISSVYSVGEGNSYVSPTAPQTPSVLGVGKSLAPAPAVHPVPPCQAQPPSSGGVHPASVRCSGCSKLLVTGHTVYQKKDSTQVFCSNVCLTGFLTNSNLSKPCHQCLKDIENPKNLISVLMDNTQKDFCSRFCLLVFNSKHPSGSMCDRTNTVGDKTAHEKRRSRTFDEVMKLGEFSDTASSGCSSGSNYQEAGREDDSEESGRETVTDRQKDVRDNLLTDGQADEERAFVQGESRGSTYPTHTPSPDSLDGAVLYHSEGGGLSPGHQNERSECDAPADRENPVPPISPLMNIQHEPIDEGYDGSLLPQTSIKWIKEEPEHQEDELRISSVYSVGGGNSYVSPTVPAPAPQTPSILGAGRSLAPAPTVHPVPLRQTRPPSSGGVHPASVRCSSCSRLLVKGQTAFQKKGSTQVFCSAVCLTGFLTNTNLGKTCHQCLKDIENPTNLISVPMDNTQKAFCSRFCLSVFNRIFNRHEKRRSRTFDEVMKLGEFSDTAGSGCSSGSKYQAAGREDNSEESGRETVTDRQKDVRDNLLTDGQADDERAFVQGESRGSTYPTHTPSPDSLDGAVLNHSEWGGLSPGHQNEDELRISSVYSAGEGNSYISPTVPAPAPQTPSILGAGRSLAPAPAVHPVPPRQTRPPSSGGVHPASVRCSGCSKVLVKGQTAYQKKDSTQVFCSNVCLTGFLTNTNLGKPCHHCLKDIENPKNLISVLMDNTQKDFCSRFCLLAFNSKHPSGSMCDRTNTGGGGLKDDLDGLPVFGVYKASTQRSECDAPAERENPLALISPLMNIKDEPIDEGYDCALLPQSSLKQIKQELEHQEDELRISSVYSVGGGNSYISPTAPQTPSIFDAGRSLAPAPPVHPVPPRQAQPPSSGGVHPASGRCSGCSKLLVTGHTAYQKKDSTQVFCSNVCLTGFLTNSNLSKPCHQCLKDIKNPRNLISVLMDNTQKAFCSRFCLSVFNSQRPSCTMCDRANTIQHEVTYDGAVHHLCSDNCFSTWRDQHQLAMNCCEGCGMYCNSKGGSSQVLTIGDVTMRFCSPTCISAYKQTCSSMMDCDHCKDKAIVSSMLMSNDLQGKVKLYCNSTCVSYSRPPQHILTGTPFPCTHCKVNAVPQYHLALVDGSIRNFCTYDCVSTFRSGSGPPTGQMNEDWDVRPPQESEDEAMSPHDAVGDGILMITSDRARKKPQKWESKEVAAVEKHMMYYIETRRIPGKDDCDRCLKLEPKTLKHRDWFSIKSYIRNRITAKRRKL